MCIYRESKDDLVTKPSTNPLTKEPKLNQATRVIGQRWTDLDEHARKLSVGEATGVAKTVASSADSTPGAF